MFSSTFSTERLFRAAAVPVVLGTIAFLAFSSQYLFLHSGEDHTYHTPFPYTRTEKIRFNLLIGAMLVCYYRTCMTDPGSIPREWRSVYPRPPFPNESEEDRLASERMQLRRCKKCEADKPQRSHHCRVCRRCIPRMDHHCPWTANCVSSRTIPHFVRFLGYAVLAMIYLETLLWQRCAELWQNRHWPSYLGPSPFQLCHLLTLMAFNSLLLFALCLLFGQAVWNLVFNMTTIEGWEIERHEAAVERSKRQGGYAHTADGEAVRLKSQEFPFDIGVWPNLVQTMGTSNVLAWFWPFARTPNLTKAFYYPTNGFEDPSLPWPPPDATQNGRTWKPAPVPPEFHLYETNEDRIRMFKSRQEADRQRLRFGQMQTKRGASFAEGFSDSSDSRAMGTGADLGVSVAPGAAADTLVLPSNTLSQRQRWKNREGETLSDYGVDDDDERGDGGGGGGGDGFGRRYDGGEGDEEDDDDDDDDDVPLSELIARKQQQQQQQQEAVRKGL